MQSFQQRESSTDRSSPPPRRRQSSLANIVVKPFAAFRAQAPVLPSATQSPVRRKPLPASASPVTRFASEDWGRPGNGHVDVERGRPQRSYSLESPRTENFGRPAQLLSPLPDGIEDDFAPRNLDEYPRGHTPLMSNSRQNSTSTLASLPSEKHPVLPDPDPRGYPDPRRLRSRSNSLKSPPRRPRYERGATSYHTAKGSISTASSEDPYQVTRSRSQSPAMVRRQPPMQSSNKMPDLTLNLDGTSTFMQDDYQDTTPAVKTPKSPGSRLTSFFHWKPGSQSGQNGINSPTTTFSEHSMSPVTHNGRKGSMPAALQIPAMNDVRGLPYSPTSPLLLPSSPHVEELQRELQELSAELASSIRREMELEDEVERYKTLSEQVSTPGLEFPKRTSDYYSDSGASSVRYPFGDSDLKIEALERMRRQAEQDKARIKVEMAERAHEIQRRNQILESRIAELEGQLRRQSGVPNNFIDNERVMEMEQSLDMAKRRLEEERQMKATFEDLVTALQQDMEEHRNERDNLRDEVVPQLRAHVEGLETEAAEVQRLTYENTRMQQEIQLLQMAKQPPQGRNDNKVDFSEVQSLRQELEVLRVENAELRVMRKEGVTLALEENDGLPPLSPLPMGTHSPRLGRSNSLIGLSRSNSLARSSGMYKRSSLARSNSVKDKPLESPGLPLSDRIKDVEDQRDALHRTLKSLLKRHEQMSKQHAKQLKALEQERDKALTQSPRRRTFNEEVRVLRDEVNQLRRRADDALQQKWQCEKGLSGLKMDLDRAEQETGSLRELLLGKDITSSRPGSSSGTPADSSQTESLDKAFKELQSTQMLSLARMKDIESGNTSSSEAQHTLELLKQSISDAEAERDAALKEADSYRAQARELQASEVEHLGKEQSLAVQLHQSAKRMDDLADQVQTQLRSNTALRFRLAEAIGRGEKQQKAAASRIEEMQAKLRAAEEELMSAQTHSETLLSRHEEEVNQMQDAHNAQLLRARQGLLTPLNGTFPKSPLSPFFAQRSPRLEGGSSLVEAGKTDSLEQRVRELERALRDAESEMGEVVSRMNMAQVEVAELQTERDEATRETRRLKNEIQSEREKVKALMG